MSAAVRVTDVSFAYDDQPVLENVSLEIDEGAFLGLIGPNGSGKTTLLKIMLGLQQPDSGSVELFGTPASAFREGTRLGYVSQQSSEADSMMPVTVREVVEMGRYPHAGLRRLSDEDHAIIDDALAEVGIADLADRRISRLSGGQKQRAYIARALASEADFLALDEPTVGVDAESVEQFYDLLDDLNEHGITIVLIEHDLGMVAEHADTMACLDGTLYEHCGTEQFLASDALERAYGSTRVRTVAGAAAGD
ncbi:metal ABC transporter ATP-binding protein [Natronolimnobius sp. AArcel1]|uniref:metal ABC transporter ATP-binding protein n=1 Tax=Natronolimnobius sp. AArcel1 TaxID=1679093 RepID=UPI0013EC687B|nr:metal ABC transporter ATP-binding protein [Natronolimnobius sp. AArcel1]NGM67727.1 metal ABC transporter ATP-binding protein [Natronolimnobius sp. AArcel1]